VSLTSTGRIDVHSHLLPGVDDGCESLSESLQCAEMLVAAGYTHSFCTPHVWPNLVDVTIENVTEWTHELQIELDTAGIALKLFPGGELSLRADLPEIVKPDRLITYGMQRKFVLFDIWAERLPSFFKPNVKWLKSLGVRVILAHPERMRAVQEHPSLADEFAEMGILLQGNLQCLTDPPDSRTRETVERFLIENRYFLLGSDLHKAATLPARLDGLARAAQLVGEAKVNQLTIENPRKLLPA
jgi:protein-tyrosine phosphatase